MQFSLSSSIRSSRNEIIRFEYKKKYNDKFEKNILNTYFKF